MTRFSVQYWMWLILAILGAAVLIDAAGRLSSGDVGAFPQLIIGFIVFSIAAPAFIYYRERRKNTADPLGDLELEARILSQKNGGSDGKK